MTVDLVEGEFAGKSVENAGEVEEEAVRACLSL